MRKCNLLGAQVARSAKHHDSQRFVVLALGKYRVVLGFDQDGDGVPVLCHGYSGYLSASPQQQAAELLEESTYLRRLRRYQSEPAHGKRGWNGNVDLHRVNPASEIDRAGEYHIPWGFMWFAFLPCIPPIFPP